MPNSTGWRVGDRQILWLVKFFAEEDYADQFLGGKLYLNRLSYFKRIENADDATRRDPNEAVYAWLQPKGLRINFLAPGMSGLDIAEKDLAGPVSIAFEDHNHVHVYCAYAVHTSGFEFKEDGKIELSPDQVAELERELAVDDRCKEFGQFAVIVRAVDFLGRLKAALQKRGQWFQGRLVEYYDDETFHGQIPIKDVPFSKQKRFDWQQEFRVCVWTGTHGDDPLWVEMGDIRDIAGKTDAERLNGMFQLNLEPVPDPG